MTFGFSVWQGHEWDPETYTVAEEPNGLWYVVLPHQCDAWEVAGRYPRGAEKAEVVNELADFIAEAHAALQALIRDQEYGHES